MTIPEVLTSAAIMVLLIGIVLGAWHFAYKNWALDRIRTRLRIDLQIAMERIKTETRLSSLDYTSLYPSEAAEYTAISFPIATPDDAGFLSFDDDGNIAWDNNVIYYKDGTKLLRREVTFTADSDSRYTQLSDTVLGGYDPDEDEIISENLSSFTIKPKTMKFDGYSPATERSDKVKFGSARLADGDYYFKFEVTGQNDDSTGFDFGIDTLSIAPSGCEREAEACDVESATASYANTFASGWGGNYYVESSNASLGENIIFKLYYDQWLESNFTGFSKDNLILVGPDLHPELPKPIEGNEECWSAVNQASETTSSESFATTETIRNFLLSGFLTVDPDQELARFEFVNSTATDITIDKAFISASSPGSSTQLSAAVVAEDTTVNVDSTTGFPDPAVTGNAEYAYLYDGVNPPEPFNYTGITATSFTGVTGIIGPYAIDNYVIERSNADYKVGCVTQLSEDLSIGATTVTVASTAGFPDPAVTGSSEYAYLDDSGTNAPLPFNYTGITATSFTVPATEITRTFSAGDYVTSSLPALLYFSDDTVVIGEEESAVGAGERIGGTLGTTPLSKVIPAGRYVWSNWAVFEIDDAQDHLVTFYVSTAELPITYWQGTSTNSYALSGDFRYLPTLAVSSVATAAAKNNIYAVGAVEFWSNSGTITSITYDTQVADPNYRRVTWIPASAPSGSTIAVSARSSDNADMSGATVWESVANGGSLSTADNGRYIEFKVTLTKTLPYGDYANYPWIDNVAIKWSGDTRMCEVGGYFTQKPNYGIIKLTITDETGNELEFLKGLEFKLIVSEEVQGKTASLTAEIEPRNTGR